MFAVVCAGRLVQTNFTQVDPTKYIFEIPQADAVNHIVVFMTGQPFPPGFGATVHFLWYLSITRPSKTNPQWVYLGILSNEKPSAIFKLGGTRNQSKSVDNLMEEDGPFQATSETIAQIGISVEPIANVMAMQNANTSTALSTSNQLVLRSPSVDLPQTAMKLLENFYNYCSSFCSTLPPNAVQLFAVPNSQNLFIPLKAFQEWYKTILHKAETDPQAIKDMEM